MAYREGYNKKVIRHCAVFNKKPNEMVYVRERVSPFWDYICFDHAHAPFDKEKYAMVLIDNRP